MNNLENQELDRINFPEDCYELHIDDLTIFICRDNDGFWNGAIKLNNNVDIDIDKTKEKLDKINSKLNITLSDEMLNISTNGEKKYWNYSEISDELYTIAYQL